MKQFVILLTLLISSTVSAKNSKQDKKLITLLDEGWQYVLSRSPETASYFGDKKFTGQLNDVSAQYTAQTAEGLEKLLNKLAKIKRGKLSTENRINYDMFKDQIENKVADIKFKEYLIPITSEGSFHVDLARMATNMSFNNVQDYEHYLSKLQKIATVFNQHIANMRNGLTTGMTQPQSIIQHYPDFIQQYIVEEPQNSVFYQPFSNINQNIEAQQAQKLQQQAQQIIQQSITPAYVQFKQFMVDEYIPKARKNIGAYALPNGKAYYQQQIKEYTTLNLSPKEIHQIGWNEVNRIKAEMQDIIKQVEFDGSFAEFLHFLRTDKQFYANSAKELLMHASFFAKKMDGKLPELFTKLPRQPYAVNPVPEEIAPNYTTGRYVSAPLDSKRPGQYWVNTYSLDKRPLYNLEALTVHEAVPGHHLQGALTAELTHLPNFRRYNYISAFGEGWGLYCEKLAKEVGFYQDPYSDFGRLTYEMWRAMRLVVDTGMHAMDMSRDEAIKLMEENTALSTHNVRTEIDRYISWPGQALSYKLGEIKIWELRKKAEVKLGTKFDIRTFHDALLSQGSVPLNVLTEIIDNHIDSHK